MKRVALLFLLLAACRDTTYIEHALAPGTFVATPVALVGAVALDRRNVPCVVVENSCETPPEPGDSCDLAVDITFDEDCPFPVGAATGTTQVATAYWYYGGEDVELHFTVDLSDVRIDGRRPLLAKARVMAWHSGGSDWSISTMDVQLVEEAESNFGDSEWYIEVNNHGTPNDPSDDNTMIGGSVQLRSDRWMDLSDVTWEPGCRKNPVFGGGRTWERTFWDTRTVDEFEFHAACDGQFEVDGHPVDIDLLR